MNKTGWALLGVVLMLVLAAGGFKMAEAVSGDGIAYTRKILPKITAHWQPQSLLVHAHPDMLAGSGRKELEKRFYHYRNKIGPLKRFEGEPRLRGMLPAKGGTRVTLVQDGVFQGGEAAIRITLLGREGSWQVLDFRVASPALPDGIG